MDRSYNKFLYIFIIISVATSIFCIATFSYDSAFAQKNDKDDEYIGQVTVSHEFQVNSFFS